MKKVFRLAVIMIIIHTCVKGQEVIPPSPNAASLGQYADVPVGYYTGVPSISVPFYTVKSGKIELPISLSYHASGIKVAQEASAVGLGWALNAGGVITRQVRGLDDFDVNGYLNAGPLPPAVENTNRPDWSDPNNPNPNTDNFNTYYTYFQNVNLGDIDGEPDIFYYNFFGFSGKLLFEKQSGNDVRAISYDQNNLVFIYHKNSQSWEVTDGNGFKYYFSTLEKSDNYTLSSTVPIDLDILDDDTEQDDEITSWYIDRAASPEQDEIEFLYNTGFFSIGQVYYSELRHRLINLTSEYSSGNGYISPLLSNNMQHSASMQEVNDVYLEKIIFNNGYIDFTLGDRDDIRRRTVNEQKPKRIEAIEVFDSEDRSIKKMDLRYYYRSSRLMLDEVQESYIGEGSITYVYNPPYRFTYDQTALPEKNSYSVDHWGYYNAANNESIIEQVADIVDGNLYINSPHAFEIIEAIAPPTRTYTKTLVPRIEDNDGSYIFINGANRETKSSYAKAAILESITYPTGGVTKFGYESNDYSSETDTLFDYGQTESFTSFDYGPIPVGQEGIQERLFSLDVSTLVTLDFTMVNHTYTPNDDGGMLLYEFTQAVLEKPGHDEIVKLKLTENLDEFFGTLTVLLPAGDYRLFASNGLKDHLELSVTASFKRRPTITTKKQGGGLRIKSIENYIQEGSEPAKRTSFIYEEDGMSTGRIMSPLQYFYEETLIQNSSMINPGNVLNYIYTANYIVSSSSNVVPLGTSAQGSFVGYDKVMVKEEDIVGGNLGKTIYHYENVEEILGESFMPGVPNIINLGNGRLLKEEYLNNEDSLVKEKVLTYLQHSPSRINIKGVKFYQFYGSTVAGGEVMFYNVYSEWWHPESTIETIYDPNSSNPLSVTTEYAFQSPVHKQTTSITQQTSAGKTKVTNLYYPSDTPIGTSTSSTTMSRMVSDNMLNPVIKQETILDGATTIEGLITNFSIDPNNHVVVANIQKLETGINTYRTETEFSQYDVKGNFRQVTLNQNASKAYLWGYNSQYPVAQVENATYSEVAFSSFETSEKGGWTYSGAPITTYKTGRKGYNLSLGSVTKTGISASTANPFRVGFWARRSSGTGNVSIGGQTEALTTAWKWVEKTITSSSLTISGSSVIIDELRLHPADALMTSYTYEPLVGMTSQTDPRGYLILYVYDSANSLRTIKDEDGNILEHYEYNYVTGN